MAIPARARITVTSDLLGGRIIPHDLLCLQFDLAAGDDVINVAREGT
jgi:hypothetical protein